MSAVPFFAWQLLFAMLLNCGVQTISIAAYAARLAGARSGRVGTAMSLYNLFVTGSRFSSMLYSPMLGALADGAQHGSGGHAIFAWQLRALLFAGALGAIAGTLALPVFVRIYLRGIGAFERTGNVVRAMLRALRPQTALSILRDVGAVGDRSAYRFSLRNMPLDTLVLNTVVSAIYGVGIVSAAYASVMSSGAARTALLSSGLINGMAVIAYNVFVDPASAFMTDQTVRGERSLDDVKSLVTSLCVTAIIGALLSQLLLMPAAFILDRVAEVIASH